MHCGISARSVVERFPQLNRRAREQGTESAAEGSPTAPRWPLYVLLLAAVITVTGAIFSRHGEKTALALKQSVQPMSTPRAAPKPRPEFHCRSGQEFGGIPRAQLAGAESATRDLLVAGQPSEQRNSHVPQRETQRPCLSSGTENRLDNRSSGSKGKCMFTVTCRGNSLDAPAPQMPGVYDFGS
jgi:hypothetical protein